MATDKNSMIDTNTNPRRDGTDSQLMRRKIMECPRLLHASMVAFGTHVPALSSNLCSHQFLLGVRSGVCFALTDSQLRHKNVLARPSVEALNDMLVAALEEAVETKFSALMGLVGASLSVPMLINWLKRRQADGSYCLGFLSTLHHWGLRGIPVFQPGY